MWEWDWSILWHLVKVHNKIGLFDTQTTDQNELFWHFKPFLKNGAQAPNILILSLFLFDTVIGYGQ